MYAHLPTKMGQSVPKCRHTKFRRRGITQKNAYKIIKYLRHFFLPVSLNSKLVCFFALSPSRLCGVCSGILWLPRVLKKLFEHREVRRTGWPGDVTNKRSCMWGICISSVQLFHVLGFLWHGFAALVPQHRRLQHLFLTSPALFGLILNIPRLHSYLLPTTVRISKNRNSTHYGDFRNP